MSPLAALTVNGFREARRNRVTTVVYVFALVLIFSSTVALDMTVATFQRVMVDLGLGAMTLICAFLGIYLGSGLIPREIERRTIFMVLARPLGRTTFIVGRYLGNLLTITVVHVVMAALLVGQFLIADLKLEPGLFAGMLGVLLQAMVISAVAFAFAATSSQFITATATVSLYSLGHLTPDLYGMADRSKVVLVQWVGKGLYYVLPNLDRLNFSGRATYNDPVGAGEVMGAVVYAVGYSVVLLVVAGLLFQRRDFK